MTKRTKVVTPKVAIGDRSSPTTAVLHALADSAQRLLTAVQPYVQVAKEVAATDLLEIELEVDDPLSDGLTDRDEAPALALHDVEAGSQ